MNKKTWILMVMLIVLLCVGSGILFFFGVKNFKEVKSNETATSSASKNEQSSIRTFANWTKEEVFQEIPIMQAENAKIGDVLDYGADNYIADVNYTEFTDYQDYLKLLETVGFEKFADNGQTGLDHTVYTSNYKKDDLCLTVTYVTSSKKTYITACEKQPLSEHLIYKEEFKENQIEDAKTKVHMLDLYDVGNSFVIQLKNGHFILNDGGIGEDLPYLIEYIESLAPEGEKPVVEAWFFSHTHSDHAGAFCEIISNEGYADRISVEGVYYNMPSEETGSKFGTEQYMTAKQLMLAARLWKTSEGKAPEVYRPVTGQRYYFSDIEIEIVLSQDQMLYSQHLYDFNDTSTWCMYRIEGQKFLLCGDADLGGIQQVMRIYDKTYFEVDIFTVFHHGINVYDTFTDFISYNTALYPARETKSQSTGVNAMRVEENNYLKSKALEAYAWGDGPKVMTFPYRVGEMELLPPTQFNKN